MGSSDSTHSQEGHFHQHMEETADMLGRRGRWVYLAWVALSLVLMAAMFAAYASLWPAS